MFIERSRLETSSKASPLLKRRVPKTLFFRAHRSSWRVFYFRCKFNSREKVSPFLDGGEHRHGPRGRQACAMIRIRFSAKRFCSGELFSCWDLWLILCGDASDESENDERELAQLQVTVDIPFFSCRKHFQAMCCLHSSSPVRFVRAWYMRI